MRLCVPQNNISSYTHMACRDIIRYLQKAYLGNPVVIAEIGVWKGASTDIFLRSMNVEKYYGIDLYKSYTYGCDHKPYEPDQKGKILAVNGDSIYNTILSKYRGNAKVKIIRKFSREAVLGFEDNSLDICFIDCAPNIDGEFENMRLFYPKVKPGGVLCGYNYWSNKVQDSLALFLKGRSEELRLWGKDRQTTWSIAKI